MCVVCVCARVCCVSVRARVVCVCACVYVRALLLNSQFTRLSEGVNDIEAFQNENKM